MSFLETLGTSKAITGTIGDIQGMQKNQQNLALGEQNMALGQQQMAMNKETLDMAIMKNAQEQHNIKKMQEEEAFGEKTTLIDLHPFYGNIKNVVPDVYNDLLEGGKSRGTIVQIPGSSEYIISNKNFAREQKWLTDNPLETQALMGKGLTALTTKISQAKTQLSQIPADKNGQAVNKKDQPILDQLNQQITNLSNVSNELANSSSTLTKHIEKEKIDTANKIAVEKARAYTNFENAKALLREKADLRTPPKANKVTLINESTGEKQVVDKNSDEYDEKIDSGEWRVQPKETTTSQSIGELKDYLKGETPKKVTQPKPAGKTKSGRNYWIWSNGQPYYSPEKR